MEINSGSLAVDGLVIKNKDDVTPGIRSPPVKPCGNAEDPAVPPVYFGGLTPSALASVVKCYVTRTYAEDLDAVSRLLGSSGDVIDRLCSVLHTSRDHGISTQLENELHLRRTVFGSNAAPTRKRTSFWAHVYNASKDFALRVLILAGLVSLTLGLVFGENKRIEWIDGAAIFLAVSIVVLVTAGNDYLRERQFAALNDKHERFCTVIRDGKQQRMNADQLLVGDILVTETGDELPADCVVLGGRQLSFDESSMTGESRSVKKTTYAECISTKEKLDVSDEKAKAPADAHHLVPSPVALSGSIIMSGSGVLLVVAVGHNSEAGQLLQKLIVDTDPTPLQNKLNALARDIGNLGLVAAVVSFTVYLAQFWITYAVNADLRNRLSTDKIFSRHIQFLVEAITIVVVAVPEGLPLAVTLSLAFSVRKMLRDQNYVRRLGACETMGGASEICSDKTGTLTKNRMTAEVIWNGVKLCEYQYANSTQQDMEYGSDSTTLRSVKASREKCVLPKMYLDLLAHAISLNSTAYFEFPDAEETHRSLDLIKCIGSATECALLLLIRDMGYDYEKVRREWGDDAQIVHRVPFNSSRKLMTTVVRHPTDPRLYRVYVKGAAEIVLRLCCTRLDTNGELKGMDAVYMNQVERQVIDQMAGQGLRTVCVAYKDFDAVAEPDWCQEASGSDPRFPTRAPRRRPMLSLEPVVAEKMTDITLFGMELGLNCLVIVGMRDPVRDEVPAAVRRCQQAGIRVRMVTGDNIETAKQIGIKCNIYHPETGGIALTGPDFYRRIGGVVCEVCRTEVCDCPTFASKKPKKVSDVPTVTTVPDDTETSGKSYSGTSLDAQSKLPGHLAAAASSSPSQPIQLPFPVSPQRPETHSAADGADSNELARNGGSKETAEQPAPPTGSPLSYAVKVSLMDQKRQRKNEPFYAAGVVKSKNGAGEEPLNDDVLTSSSTPDFTDVDTVPTKKKCRYYCCGESCCGRWEKKVLPRPLGKVGSRVRVDVINDLAAFARLAEHLEILARSQPRDKYAIVLGLKSLGAVVAVTGDGTNDAPALKKADVGFAMGITGKEVAKQAADIVLLDDNFESIVKAVKWGRSIYDNIRRFLQFQLTVNIVAVSTALLGSIVLGESPLNAVQLLWVNLIMDTFASLALATEPATDELLDRPPHSRNEYLVNRLMTRNIIGQAVYQLLVICVLIFTGECWIPEHASRAYHRFEGQDGFSEFCTTCGNGATVTPGRRYRPFSQVEVYRRDWAITIGPSRHYTVVFNTFVCLQIFNLVNARKIHNEWNVCSHASSSSLWLLSMAIICIGQIFLVHFGGRALNCHLNGLTWDQWFLSIALGSGGLLVGFFLRFIPAERLSFIPQTGIKEADLLTTSTNLALASRGRLSTERLSSRLAAGLHNENRQRPQSSDPLRRVESSSGWLRRRPGGQSSRNFVAPPCPYHSAPALHVFTSQLS